MILYLKKISIVETGSPHKAVLLTSINNNVDGSSVFGISNEHSDFTIEGGNTYINSATPSLDVRVMKPTSSTINGASSNDLDQLKSWVSNQTKVRVIGFTIDGGVIYFGNGLTGYSDTRSILVANEQLSDNDVFAFKITKKTNVGFDPVSGIHQGGFQSSLNMASLWDWKEGNVQSGIAAGWRAEGFQNTPSSFSSGEQTLITTNNLDENRFNLYIYGAFEGETVTSSFTLDNLTYSVGAGDFITRLRFRFFDENNSAVGGTITSDFDVADIGNRITISATAGSDVCYYRLEVVGQRTSGTGQATIVISDPMISLTGSTTYTKF